MAISLTKKVLGKDVLKFKLDYGYTVPEVCSLFGLSNLNHWSYITGEDSENEMVPYQISVLYILYNLYPDLIQLPTWVEVKTTYDNFNKSMGDNKISQGAFSKMLGRNSTAYNKWTREGVSPSGTTRALINALYRLATEYGAEEVQKFRKIAEAQGKRYDLVF